MDGEGLDTVAGLPSGEAARGDHGEVEAGDLKGGRKASLLIRRTGNFSDRGLFRLSHN